MLVLFVCLLGCLLPLFVCLFARVAVGTHSSIKIIIAPCWYFVCLFVCLFAACLFEFLRSLGCVFVCLFAVCWFVLFVCVFDWLLVGSCVWAVCLFAACLFRCLFVCLFACLGYT